MAKSILPTVSSLLTPAIDAIVASRPRTLAQFNRSASRYNDLPAMWRGQVLVALNRLGDEAASARLRLAKGEPLRALCASEFGTVLPPAPQNAYVDIYLGRPTTGAGSGVIRKDSIFVKAAQPGALPLPIAAATYKAVRAVYVTGLTAFVQAVAVSPGADGNLPVFWNGPGVVTVPGPSPIQAGQPLYDPTLKVQYAVAGGGSSGLTDPVLVAAAKAYAVGQFGPTDGAVVAGILRQQSVRHFAAFRASGSVPYGQAFIADQSWGWSAQWMSVVQQQFADAWQGFGCRTRFGRVANWLIAVSPTLVLKSTDDLNNTDSIDASVRAAARSYFDDRPDWYRWRTASLQAVLSKCDARILHCSAVTVTDPVLGGAIPEPPNTFGITYADTVTHYFLTDDHVYSQYQPPL